MKKAAFKTGQVLKYLGNRQTWTKVNGKDIPIIYNGMQVEIIETHPPQKGHGIVTLKDGEQIFDGDNDGYNIYKNSQGQKRIIWPDNKKDWQILENATK